MRRDPKLVWVLLASVALMMIGLIVGLRSLSEFTLFDGCANEILQKHPSPSGKVRVVVFQRNCGATTGFSTQASVLKAGEDLPNRPGNLFISDTDHGAAPSGPGGGPELRVDWQGERALWLSHHENARIFQAETKVRGVSIQYTRFQ